MNKQLLKSLSHNYSFLPVNYSINLDSFDPFKIIKFYDSNENHSMIFNHEHNRYTTIIINPLKIITAKNSKITITDSNGNKNSVIKSPINYLNQIYKKNRIPKIKGLPPFTNGLIGYFSYDFIRYIKDIHLKKPNDNLNLPDFDLFQPNISMIYDHKLKQLNLIKIIQSKDLNKKYNLTIKHLKNIAQTNKTISKQHKAINKSLRLRHHFNLQFNLNQFKSRVIKAKDHIKSGDVFQLILSNPYITEADGSLINVAQTLSHNNYSPYHFYFTHNDFSTVGASPETLVKKYNKNLYSYPLAGTRRKGKNDIEDKKFIKELKTNPKELSEHNMLVDLGRNDLGSISRLGTVKIAALRQLLKFSEVMHLGSKIHSKIQDRLTPIDVISHVLPAGTLSGAPKYSAIQIINQLENRKRGIYGGGIGFIDFNGDMDLCIGIRLAYKKQKHLVVHSGAGIVSDSNAKHEFNEFKNKSRLMMNTIKQVKRRKKQ